MPERTKFEGAFTDFLEKSLSAVDRESLELLLGNAKVAAKEVGVYSRDRGAESYHTIKAALELAVAVWGAEKQRRQDLK